MRVLCVAEKPSISKSITQILSGGQFTTRNSRNKYIKNYDFNYPQTNSVFTVTAVTGHVMEHDFNIMYSKWTSCDPFALFEAPVECRVKKESDTIAENLKTEARRAQMLMIWTDCDREGENIGAEIMKICKKANPNITVRRARFSAIIAQQIHHAAQNPVQLDMAQANAVETRILLDLRIGSAFTRLQTLNLQNRHEALRKELISYGPCQFPTLGFVVARYNKLKNFKPEPFWYIFLSLTRPSATDSEGEETVFTWRRGHLFDLDAALALYNAALTHPVAQVTKVTVKDTKKWKPLPLTTVDLQKAGSRILKISPKRVLDIAEGLYQKGFLSYPRTETDVYDPQFDFMTLIGKQTADPAWGGFAGGLQNGGFSPPRKGKHDDHAHPPIHPTAHAGNLVGDDKRVYEYITRRFLASCSKDALGWQTTVDVQYGDEEFYTTGLIIRERNYLDVFPYDKWADKEVPNFQEGEAFVPTECRLDEGQTSKPTLLTEADLVSLMDEHGIGTDATIAQHIQTIIDRGYVIERMQGATKYLVPSTLGIGLVEGYDAIGFDQSLSKPELRRETEMRMVEICEGVKSKNDVLVESIERYKEMFMRTKIEFEKLVAAVGNRIHGQGPLPEVDLGEAHEDDDEDGGGGPGGGGGGGRGARGGRGRGARGAARSTRGASTRGASSTRARRGRGRGGVSAAGGRPPSPPPPPPPAVPRQPPAALADDDDEQYWSDPPSPPRPAPPPARARPAPPRSGPSSSSAQPQCDCGIPAAERTVTKESANKGKRFWTCGQNQTCQFFQWSDGASGASATAASSSSRAGPSSAPYSSASTVVPSKRPHSAMGGGRRCGCDLTAVLKVSKSAANSGRKYWSCPNGSRQAQCSYFEWAADDEDGPAEPLRRAFSNNTGSAANAGGGAGASGSGGSGCYRCGEEGHWASACPNTNGAQPSRSFGSGGGGGGGGASGACFNCGEEGHFSSNCPQGRREQKGSSGDGACFKCGQPGHYSNACPGGGTSSTGSSSRRGSGSRGGKRGRGRGSSKAGTRGRKKSSFSAADEAFWD